MTTSKEKNWFKSETYNFNDNHKCDEYPDQIVSWGNLTTKKEKEKKHQKRAQKILNTGGFQFPNLPDREDKEWHPYYENNHT